MTPAVHGRRDPPRPDTSPQRRRALLSACWAGREPAESLEPADREQLVYELWALGWTDAEIAAHTRMSTYTAGRIRERLGLAPNTTTGREGAA
jgi:hypothetical protein